VGDRNGRPRLFYLHQAVGADATHGLLASAVVGALVDPGSEIRSTIVTYHNGDAGPLRKRQTLLISSRNNPKVKAIRDLRHRKERERSGLFFVAGLRLVAAALELHAVVELLVVAPELLADRAAYKMVEDRQRDLACLEVTAEVFESLVANHKDAAHGIGVVVRQRWDSLEQISARDKRCWVALEAIHYPANLGSILRTCDAVGGAGAILLEHTTDPYDPASVRASVGAIFSQRLIRANVAEFAAWKRRRGALVVGTSPAAAVDYQAVAYQPPLILFMGSEPHGLSAESLALCDLVVTIPMVGHNDSLNLSVAASVMLYEIFNQRRAALEAGIS
jgi:RNA methyltransferase, TrmH family